MTNWRMAGIAIVLWACGGGGGGVDAGTAPRDAGGGSDSGAPNDSGGGRDSGGGSDSGARPLDGGALDAGASDGGGGGAALAPCGAGDWVTGMTAVTIPSGMFAYSPRCLQVPPGTMVSLPGQSGHPLTRGTRGTAGNPIPESSTSDVMVTFTTPGLYPYYCRFHGDDTGGGMSGVIRVE